jgi:hypothetical protein
MRADGGIHIIKAGIYSQETRTFKLSSVKMLKGIYKELGTQNFSLRGSRIMKVLKRSGLRDS